MAVADAAAGRWLVRAAERFGSVDAIAWSGGCWTWAALAEHVDVTTRWLERAGVGPGDTVAMLAENGPAWARWLHAVAARGAVLLPLNTRLSTAELVFQLADAGARTCIVGSGIDAARVDAMCAAVPACTSDRIDAWGDVDVDGEDAISIDARGVSETALSDERERAREVASAERTLAVLYTSGTSGRPKGVRLSARAFASSAGASQRLVPLHSGDRWLVCMPLFHVGGLSILVRCALAGATAIVQAGFDAAAVSSSLERDGVTHVSFVPTMLERVLDCRGDARAPTGLRCVLLGGSAASPSLVERAWALGYPVAPTYGLTEACSQVATRDTRDRQPPVTARLEVLDGLELIVRDGMGRACTVGAEGEICVRGHSVTTGYVGHASNRAAVDDAGWLATGDVGRLDAEGRLEVLDRRDDLIVSGGENVYPAEVERVLMAHPGVAEAAVVARPDAAFGARPVAFWVPQPAGARPSAAELATHARRSLAGYKIPVAFFTVEVLPRTASGKLQRAKLRALGTREPGCEGARG